MGRSDLHGSKLWYASPTGAPRVRRRRPVMTIYEHVLDGCAPVPLAGYLKALGTLRLVAEQIDPNAKGFWRDERFVLRTQVTENELLAFFVERYQPSAIISPWNGRA